ncbi:MAG: MerR family transcriptional regulator [Christensenellales bacterium]|jgi:DNA-binding transcriptional MerR regulator
MKYRIGEVAELFGLTKGGVRFLEKKGVIRSQRDERNGYRYYDREQITNIKQLRSYQAMGFSLEEAMDLMHNGDPDRVLACIQKKECELAAQIEHIRRMVSALKRHADRVSSAGLADSVWVKSPRPAMYRISVWEDLVRQGAIPETTDPNILRERKEAEASFISCMPEVTLSLLVRKADNGFIVARGSCIEKEDAHRLNVVINSQVEEYPAHSDCYCAILKSDGSRRALDEVLKQVERMEQRGERLSGDIIGRMLFRRCCPNSFIAHLEFWIPFEKACTTKY